MRAILLMAAIGCLIGSVAGHAQSVTQADTAAALGQMFTSASSAEMSSLAQLRADDREIAELKQQLAAAQKKCTAPSHHVPTKAK